MPLLRAQKIPKIYLPCSLKHTSRNQQRREEETSHSNRTNTQDEEGKQRKLNCSGGPRPNHGQKDQPAPLGFQPALSKPKTKNPKIR